MSLTSGAVKSTLVVDLRLNSSTESISEALYVAWRPGDGKWWAIVCTEGDQATTDCNNTSLLIRHSTVQWTNKPPRACFLSLTQFPRRRKCYTFIYLWRISHSKRRSTVFFFFYIAIITPLGISRNRWNIDVYMNEMKTGAPSVGWLIGFYPRLCQDSWDAVSVIISPYACDPVKTFGIHGIQRMNQNNFSFSSIATSAGESFHSLSYISQKLKGRQAQHINSHILLRMNCDSFCHL